MDRTAQFYSTPSYHFKGAGFPVYAGSRRQRGGSILGALKRLALPILGKLKQRAINETWGLAKGAMYDTMSGKSLKQSLMKRGIQGAKNIGIGLAGDALRSVRNKAQNPSRAVSNPKRIPTKRKRTRARGPKQSAAKKRRTTKNF